MESYVRQLAYLLNNNILSCICFKMALFIHSKVIVCFYVVCTIVTYLQSIKQSEVIIIKHFKNILNYAYFIYIYIYIYIYIFII